MWNFNSKSRKREMQPPTLKVQSNLNGLNPCDVFCGRQSPRTLADPLPSIPSVFVGKWDLILRFWHFWSCRFLLVKNWLISGLVKVATIQIVIKSQAREILDAPKLHSSLASQVNACKTRNRRLLILFWTFDVNSKKINNFWFIQIKIFASKKWKKFLHCQANIMLNKFFV
jgi:hypothetical protein